ncbi:hypothetical protein DXE05_12460 [Vibrio parahaemolyticus]|nr:hypothetical protein DXE05_12460 [Vibrio parahaemolyticus]
MVRGIAGEEQFFYQRGFTGPGLADKSDIAYFVDRHRASLQDGVKNLRIARKWVAIETHALHWSRAGLPSIRLPCHFPDDSMHKTTFLDYCNLSMP